MCKRNSAFQIHIRPFFYEFVCMYVKKSICGGAANTREASRLFQLVRLSIEHAFDFVNTIIEHFVWYLFPLFIFPATTQSAAVHVALYLVHSAFQ